MERKINALVLLTKRMPPSSRVRFTACRDEFLNHGIETEYIPIPSGPIARLKLFLRIRAYDIVIIQKKTSFHRIELVFMKYLNPNIIFDFDDAVMFHELEHGKPLNGKNIIKFLRTISYCSAVVAGNSFLAEFARPNCPDVYVLPTPIDTEKYILRDYSEKKDTVVIGWIGVSGNLKYLKAIEPALRTICKKYPSVVFKVISNETIQMDDVNMEYKKWRIEDEIEDLKSLDIGIMPLDDSLWARGKCGYKILQYMGVGVPVVASPVGINAEFIRHGENGFLAKDIEEWEMYLDQIIKNQRLRIQIGLRGRKTVEDTYSVKGYVKQYSDLIKGLHEPKNEKDRVLPA